MRSLNAGKSSRLVVTVEPCLGTQHLHVLAKFPASFPHEMTLEMWGCLFKFTGNPPVYQFVGNGFKCYMKPDNLNLFQDFLKRTLAEPHSATDYNWGILSWLPLKCFPNFRVTITCQPPSHLNLLDASKTEWHRAGQPNSPAKLQAKLQGMKNQTLGPQNLGPKIVGQEPPVVGEGKK